MERCRYCSVPVHDGQEPEGPKPTITRTCTGASRDILLSAKPLDLCPLGHMECHGVKAAINEGHGYDVKGIRLVPEGLLVNPGGELKDGAYFSPRYFLAGHTEKESNQCSASNDGRKDSDAFGKAEVGDEELEGQWIDDAACSGSG